MNPSHSALIAYDGCTSALHLDEASGVIISTFKDAGDQSLATPIARFMYNATPPDWISQCAAISFIPDSTKAFKQRTFDHGWLIASQYAKLVGLPLLELFNKPSGKDQRKLSRTQRLSNMQSAFELVDGVALPESLLLIDDVYTTGATLQAAATCLKNAGVQHVFCVTFARTPPFSI